MTYQTLDNEIRKEAFGARSLRHLQIALRLSERFLMSAGRLPSADGKEIKGFSSRCLLIFPCNPVNFLTLHVLV